MSHTCFQRHLQLLQSVLNTHLVSSELQPLLAMPQMRMRLAVLSVLLFVYVCSLGSGGQ